MTNSKLMTMATILFTLLLTSTTTRAEEADTDKDGVSDTMDNCPLVANTKQEDLDGDKHGDACDLDRDGDNIKNEDDVCPEGPEDYDGVDDFDGCSEKDMDMAGEDPKRPPPDEPAVSGKTYDRDNDGVPNNRDNCPDVNNITQFDVDGDGLGDACDPDADGDEVANATDNCTEHVNFDQSDSDSDGIGDVCDNCPKKGNADQKDTDSDKIGDRCDDDVDGDAVVNAVDKCWEQKEDRDGFEDEDGCPDPDNDKDETPDATDKCPLVADNKRERFGTDGCPVPVLTAMTKSGQDPDTLRFTFNFDKPVRYTHKRQRVEDTRSHLIVLQFEDDLVNQKPDTLFPGSHVKVRQKKTEEGKFLIVAAATEERDYKVLEDGNNVILVVYGERERPTLPPEPPAVAATTPPSTSPPTTPPIEVASADEHPLPADVIDADGDGKVDDGEGEVLAQNDKSASAPEPPPPPPSSQPPVVIPPSAPPGPAPAPPKAEESPVVVPPQPPPPPPPVKEVEPGPAKLVRGDKPKDEAFLKDAGRIVADHERGCDNAQWELRGATLRGKGVSWQDTWSSPIDEATRRLGQCGVDYRLEVCGVEDITSYGSKDIDVRVQGGREAAGAARAHGRAMRIFQLLQDKLGRDYTDQLGFCEDRILAKNGERGVDVEFLHAPRPASTVVAAVPGPKGDQGLQGPPGPPGTSGPPGEGVVSTFQLGVNTQLKDMETGLLLSLAQLRLGVGDLLFLQMELGGAQWRLTGGLGAGVRYELIEDWLAVSAVGFLRARSREWSDFETGVAGGIEGNLGPVVLELRGELKGLKGNGNVLHEDYFPFVPAATLGGFVGWKF